MIVNVSATAEAELRQIGDWIANESPLRADKFVDELILACQRIADAPFASPAVQASENPQIRRRTYRNYLIFYSMTENTIEILHVIHGARDYEKNPFPGITTPPPPSSASAPSETACRPAPSRGA
jgi:plasmid stabilization system protein ParE